MKRRTIVTAITAFCTVALTSALVTRATVRTGIAPDDVNSLRRLREFCGTVRAALEMDAVSFESDDPRIRQEAADRFDAHVSGDSWRDIRLCAPIEPDLRGRDMCWLRDDFKCLAQLARLAEASIPIFYDDDR